MFRETPLLKHRCFISQNKTKGAFKLPFVILRVQVGAIPANMTGKGKKMRKIESLTKYVISPNPGFYGGFEYDGKDIFLCNDHDTDTGYDFNVKQEIKNNILYTDITREYTRHNGLKVKEASHFEIEINEGQLLVYVEGTGFTIPEYNMCTVDDAIDIFSILKSGG